MPATPETGQAIAAWRKRHGLSQPGLAALWGVPLWTLRNWEQGRRDPGPFVWFALEQAPRPLVKVAPYTLKPEPV